MTDATDATGTGPDPTVTPPGSEPEDGETVVELADVTRTYEGGATVDALSNVSLTLSEGSYTAVMGPSGSGKSTLLNLVGGLDTPTAGTVRLDGQDVDALSEAERARARGRTVEIGRASCRERV